MKVSEWLATNTWSHDIYDDASMREQFKTDTGEDAPWNSYTEQATRRAIRRRGKGGTVSAEANGKKLCYGVEMAEACADKWGDDNKRYRMQSGFGSRWRSALESLEGAGK